MNGLKTLLLCICSLALLGCSKEPQPVVIDVTGASSAPAPARAAAEPSAPAEGEPPAPQRGARAEVRSTVAYVLACAEGPALYGAAAYENTGDTPLSLVKAGFTFNLAGQTEEVDFVPIFAKETVVLPGETAYAVLWYSMPDLAPGADVSLSASLQWEDAPSSRTAVQVDNLHLAQNYPGFTTIAGTLTAQADCPCNLIYTAFYGQSGELLGVWYFTENARLMADEPKAFTSHMKELPLDGLAEAAVEVRSFGIGME